MQEVSQSELLNKSFYEYFSPYKVNFWQNEKIIGHYLTDSEGKGSWTKKEGFEGVSCEVKDGRFINGKGIALNKWGIWEGEMKEYKEGNGKWYFIDG